MPKRAINPIKREDEACECDRPFNFRQGEPSNLLPYRIQFPRVMDLPRFLEPVPLCRFRVPTIVRCEPPILGR